MTFGTGAAATSSRTVAVMKTLVFLVATLAACGWAPNSPSTPSAFSGEKLTAITVVPYYDRICGARLDATVLCIDPPTTIADAHPILAPLGDKVVQLPTTVTQLAGGGNAVCARLDDASVWCWAEYVANDPIEIATDVAKMSISPDGLVCLLATSGGVTCLRNDGTYFQADMVPGVGPVELGGHRAVSVALGDHSLAVVLDDGTVMTWDVSKSSLSVAGTPVAGVSNAIAVSGGGPVTGGSGEHLCALLADATLACWGQNENAELGTGTATDTPRNAVPRHRSARRGAGRRGRGAHVRALSGRNREVLGSFRPVRVHDEPDDGRVLQPRSAARAERHRRRGPAGWRGRELRARREGHGHVLGWRSPAGLNVLYGDEDAFDVVRPRARRRLPRDQERRGGRDRVRFEENGSRVTVVVHAYKAPSPLTSDDALLAADEAMSPKSDGPVDCTNALLSPDGATFLVHCSDTDRAGSDRTVKVDVVRGAIVSM